jgi:uncharacterized membrane protein
MHTWYLISVWIHVLAAMVWVGGMAFLAAVIVPTIRHPDWRGRAASLIAISGRRFKHIGWGSLLILIATGITNLTFRGLGPALTTSAFWEASFGQILLWKLHLVVLVLLLSAIHDFYIGPRAVAAWESNPNAPSTRRLRKAASWMGRINFLLALAIVALAVMLLRGAPWQ